MAAYTSSGTGNWSSAATWGGTGPPSTGDTATISAGHTVTVDANTSVGDATTAITINATGVLVVGAFTLTLDGDVINNGTVTQNAGSTVSFAGNHDIVSGNGSAWNINGTSGNRATLQAAATFGFSLQTSAAGNGITFTADYCNITRWGRGTATTADMAMYVRSHFGATSTIELSDCKVDDYWRMRFGVSATPSASSIFRFNRTILLNPNDYAWEYTCAQDFNSGTRGAFDCVFIGDAAQSTIYIDAGTAASWTNPLLVSNCAVEDVLVWARNSNYVQIDLISRDASYTGGNQHVLMSNRSTAQGGWKLYDSVFVSTRLNAHNVSNGGGDEAAPATQGEWANNICFGNGSQDNHFLINGPVTFTKNISVGGNHVVATLAGTTPITVERQTHIHTAGNFDDLVNFEGSNWGANLWTIKNNLQVGIGDAGERGVGCNVVTAQDVAYSDYNCWYQTADHYDNITAANNTLTEGVDTGFGVNDITDNPMLNNASATVATWDTSLGGVGTVANAYNEVYINLTGYDRSGVSQTPNTNYTKASLLTYLRTAFTPTNAALQGTGLSGVDIGAMAVVVPSTGGTKYGLKMGFGFGLGA